MIGYLLFVLGSGPSRLLRWLGTARASATDDVVARAIGCFVLAMLVLVVAVALAAGSRSV